MPSNKTHNAIGRRMGGRSTDWVDKFIDKPAATLGRRHRVLFHDPETVATMFILGGPNAAARAASHIATDQIVSAAKSLMIKNMVSQGYSRQIAEMMVNNINI